MMVLGVSVTSTPNSSLAGGGVSALGADAGGGGGSAGAGPDVWAKAAEAKPSGSTAARAVARNGRVIEFSLNPPRSRLSARGFGRIYHAPRRSGINENA